MKIGNLSQGVKKLRKRKGLSQEELAENSGLSLRTIQRVENGETKPTGETLKRISAVLSVTLNELIDWDIKKECSNTTIKAKNEYLHIFDDKLIITVTPKINDLVEDYGKSVNNVFKSLMVFFIFIPIFTTLAIIFYNIGKIGLAINAGAFGFFFLVMAFYIILFTSGSSLIKIENLHKIKIQRKSFINVVVIFHKEFGRLKKRHLIIKENQIDTMKSILLSRKLIEELDIEITSRKINTVTYILTFIIIVTSYLLIWKNANNNVLEMMAFYGVIVIFISIFLIKTMIIGFIRPLFDKTTKR